MESHVGKKNEQQDNSQEEGKSDQRITHSAAKAVKPQPVLALLAIGAAEWPQQDEGQHERFGKTTSVGPPEVAASAGAALMAKHGAA